MCYLLVIAAPESASAAISEITVGELSTWKENNASISTAVPEGYTLHAIGVAHHCSCGCVKTDQAEDDRSLVLTSDAARMIGQAVTVAGQLAFIVHWISTDLCSEKFTVSFGPGLSSFMLLHPNTSFKPDQLI